uniref:Uncharacterized protein n=1 Tax=Oryza barthii TaxID=65489 RepID=A0A0D3HNS2_9ORYZ
MSTPTEHASECASGSSQRYSFSSLHFTSLVTCWSSRKAMPMETCKLFFRLTTFLVLSCQEIAYCQLPNINCWESGAFCVSTNHKLAESWHLLLFAVPSLAEKERRCRSGHEFCERYHLSPVLSCPRKKKKKKEKKKGRRKTDDHEVVHVI